MVFAGLGGYFNNLRNDQNIPEKCRATQINYFKNPHLDFFTVGIQGAVDRGFTYEYPIKRDEAHNIWSYVKRNKKNGSTDQDVSNNGQGIRLNTLMLDPGQIDVDGKLNKEKELIIDNMDSMDFDFHSEGDVLELLAVLAIEQKLGSKYFVYGSVAYHDLNETRTKGELDLVVSETETCHVVAVGEAKLGVDQLSHAHHQLNRFKNFLKSTTESFFFTKLWPGSSGEL